MADDDKKNDRGEAAGDGDGADRWDPAKVEGTGTAADKVRAALADPELQRALSDLRALTPAGEPLFMGPLRTLDARDEVPAAEEVVVEDGAVLVAHKEAAAAYVEDAAPSTGRAPRMPTGKIRLSAEVVASDTRRQVTQPSIRREAVTGASHAHRGEGDVAAKGTAKIAVGSAPVRDASAIDAAARDVEAASPQIVGPASNVGSAPGLSRAADSRSPRAKPAQRANETQRRVVPIVLVSGFVFVTVVVVGLTIARRGGEHAGVDGAPIRAAAESLQAAAAASCSAAGREPCPTVSVTSSAASALPATNSATPNGSAVPVSPSAKTSATATAKPGGTSTDDVYADAATPSAAPSGTSASSDTSTQSPASVGAAAPSSLGSVPTADSSTTTAPIPSSAPSTRRGWGSTLDD